MKRILKQIRKNPVYRKAVIVVLFSFFLFICVYIRDNSRKLMTDENGREIIKRSSEVGKKESIELKVKAGEVEESVSITVSGQAFGGEELKKKFEETSENLEKLILGENEDLDNVREDLNLITEIPDTGISVTWELDNYEVMDIRGGLRQENLIEEGTLVKLTALLRYEEEKAACEFYARVFPPRMNSSEKMIQKIEEQIRKNDEETRTEEYLPLPDTVNGMDIQWEYTENIRSFAILILGAGGACMLCISDRQRRKENEKRKMIQMKTDYPQIINKFNLYIGAGMTVRKAWFCIAGDYEREKSRTGKKQAYEEMIYTMHQIQGGTAEGEAYEKYGVRCGIPVYRKFGTMISQNLRKGSKGLSDLLKREAQEAFEERKNQAKKQGEEAGTKLMIPMFMMLAIVFVIVIVPAFFSIQI